MRTFKVCCKAIWIQSRRRYHRITVQCTNAHHCMILKREKSRTRLTIRESLFNEQKFLKNSILKFLPLLGNNKLLWISFGTISYWRWRYCSNNGSCRALRRTKVNNGTNLMNPSQQIENGGNVVCTLASTIKSKFRQESLQADGRFVRLVLKSTKHRAKRRKNSISRCLGIMEKPSEIWLDTTSKNFLILVSNTFNDLETPSQLCCKATYIFYNTRKQYIVDSRHRDIKRGFAMI